MKAPKFTPGPWRSVPTTTHDIDLVTIRRDVVSDGAEFSPAFVAGDITPEDADLIAAAPELYEALERALPILIAAASNASSADTYKPPQQIALEMARAALAKAVTP